MLQKSIYKGIEITQLLSGWFSALSPISGYLKADTLQGVKSLIDKSIKEDDEAETAFFKAHPELNP